jgi:hypothetical protein
MEEPSGSSDRKTIWRFNARTSAWFRLLAIAELAAQYG